MPAPPPVVQTSELNDLQFHEAVEALQPRVAVFDCDGTMWSGDAGSGFMRWSMESGLLPGERTRWLQDRYEAYGRGEVSELAICGEMVQVYAGLPVSQLREAAEGYFDRFVAPRIFPSVDKLLRKLKAAGVDLWAVSSTNDWVIEAAVHRYGIDPDHVLCARVATGGDGCATDHLLDVPTDQGKVTALHRAGITAPDAVFGNSVHDAAMLAIARGAFAVNPSPALQAMALQKGWNVYKPATEPL